MKCCAEDRGCCTAVQKCCIEGSACCEEAKVCCDPKADADKACCDDGESCALVQLAVGSEHILARITRRSRAQLQLEPGDRVIAQIKSVAVKNAPAAGR